MTYLDSNGLKNGCVPAGVSCPWLATCNLRMDRCPSVEKPMLVPFSCGAASLYSLAKLVKGNR